MLTPFLPDGPYGAVSGPRPKPVRGTPVACGVCGKTRTSLRKNGNGYICADCLRAENRKENEHGK